MSAIKYKRVDVDGFGVAYREAGPVSGPALLLLHGFPTSSHMFRNLIPKLADRYRVVAPDLPGFGQSDLPPGDQFKYTFSNLAKVMVRFTEALKLSRFAVYRLRLWFTHWPAYGGGTSGAGDGHHHAERQRLRRRTERGLESHPRGTGKEPTKANRDALRTLLTPETTYWQYTTGVKDASIVSPDGYNLDNYYMPDPARMRYSSTSSSTTRAIVDMYPKFQRYFASHQPPLLAVWGNGEPVFSAAGAEAFKRDITNAKVTFFDTGHFALETHCDEIAMAIRDFLPGVGARAPRGDETLRET